MKYIYYRDLKKRSSFKKFEVKRLFLFSLLKYSCISFEIKVFLFRTSVLCYPRYSSRFCFKNRCSSSSTSRSVRLIRDHNPISRQLLSKKILHGLLFPFRLSSW